MAMTPPRYGNFRFGESILIDTLIERLEQIAGTFLNDSPFSSYMTTQDSRSFYGLEYKEVRQLFTEHQGKMKSLSTSSSTPQGKGVSVNLYFEKNGVRARGQFVIATGDYSTNEQIEEMILGVWTPRPEPEPESEPEVKSEPQPESEKKPSPKRPKKSETKRVSTPVDSIDITLDTAPSEKTESDAPIQVSSFREAFFFNREISADKLVKLLQRISSQYMNDVPFSVNLTTMDGEPQVDIGIEGLKRFVGLKRNQIQVVSLDASTADGELVDIKLLFKPDLKGPNAEIDIFSSHTDPIKELVWERLRWTGDVTGGQMMVEPGFDIRDFEVNASQCIVSMPLDAYWSDPLWEEVSLILKEADLTAIRAESLFSTDSLESNWKHINESGFFLADLTYKQPEVFYKLGIAQTLGKPLIIMSQHDRDIPEDFKRFPCIIYNNNNEEGLNKLKADLQSAIRKLAG